MAHAMPLASQTYQLLTPDSCLLTGGLTLFLDRTRIRAVNGKRRKDLFRFSTRRAGFRRRLSKGDLLP